MTLGFGMATLSVGMAKDQGFGNLKSQEQSFNTCGESGQFNERLML